MRYTERLADAGSALSVGRRGDAYDHERREGIQLCQPDPFGLGHGLKDAIQRAVPRTRPALDRLGFDVEEFGGGAACALRPCRRS